VKRPLHGWRLAPAMVLLACAAAICPAHAQQAVEVRMRAMAGDAPLACGQRVDALGVSRTPAMLADLRLYVSGVELRRDDGSYVPLALEQDRAWQHRDVALLDFEDGSGSCNMGTKPMRDVVRGTVPEGRYRGLRFTLGVPPDLNHADPTLAPAPLNLTAMFWSWQAGYKFLKLDLAPVAPAGGPVRRVAFSFHVGSTGCAGGMRGGDAPRCAQPNRVVVDLAEFDPATDHIIADVGALLAGTAIETNAPGTSPGCMSFPNDADCDEAMPRIGLSYGARAAMPQVFFRAGRR